jgi:hypothetical protein
MCVLADSVNFSSKTTEKPCHIEVFIQKLVSDRLRPSLSAESQALLPYFIYGAQDNFRRNFRSHNLNMSDCHQSSEWSKGYLDDTWIVAIFKNEFQHAYYIKKLILSHALLVYNVKYGNTSRPEIDQDEIPIYEERANSGDLGAIFELKRFYEYPDINYYNPEQTESRYWLFKAIEAGDEASMYEAGYDRPYSVRTELTYEETTVAVDVACVGIVKSGNSTMPACFLYNILFGENSSQVGHLVLVEDLLSGLPMRPQFIVLIKLKDQVFVKLVSYSDKFRDRKRLDIFSIDGEYLGSDIQGASADYFWNYRLRFPPVSNTLPQHIRSITNDGEIIETAKIRLLPYVESFQFWEAEFPKMNVLQALNKIYPLNDANNIDCSGDISLQLSVISENENEFFDRMNKFYQLDLYQDIRINARERTSLSGIERGYFAPEFQHNPCREYIPPRAFIPTLTRDSPYHCDPIEAFKAYEQLGDRPSYVIELGSQVESVQMFQVCRYLGNFPEIEQDSFEASSYAPELPIPCYAIVVRANTEDGFRYHFVINSISKVETPEVSNVITRSTLYMKQGDDGNSYFVLLNELRSSFSNISYENFPCHNASCRADVFDDQFLYLGSTDDVFSSGYEDIISMSMVPGYKRLPKILLEQLAKWQRSGLVFSNIHEPDDLLYYFVYPDCSDIIVEQHRNNQQIEVG